MDDSEAEVAYNGTALEPFIQRIKQKLAKDTCDSYIFETPYPTLSHKQTSASGKSSTGCKNVDNFKAWGCSIIVLSWQTFFPQEVPEKFVCVKGCGRATVVKNGWYSKLVRALGLQRPLFILSQDYRCKDCHAKPDGKGGYGSTLYLAHKEEILSQLASFVRLQVPVVFTETGVPVERSLQDLVSYLAPEAVGFPSIARLVKEIHVAAEKRRELVYYEYQLQKRAQHEKARAKKQKAGVARFFVQKLTPAVTNQQQEPIQQWAAGRRVPDWTAGPALLSGLFLQQAAAKEPMYNRQMAQVTGEFLATDHCHKLMRKIR
jgi:hypothetical protein